LLLNGLEPLALSAEGFFALVRRWTELRSSLRRFVSRYDVVLCPVAAGPAPRHGRRPSDDGELGDYAEYGYSFAYAIAGVPVVVVPAGTERGLPVGVQVVGRAYCDHVALAAAAALERALVDALPAPPALAASGVDGTPDA
jgi:Asp-tRNA(Asn)/Glu-tRNA(Gln) amidotransferase A subunit family amidase